MFKMSTINPKDVKSLRDVRTLLNEVDNKLEDYRLELNDKLNLIERHLYDIENPSVGKMTTKQHIACINDTVREVRHILNEDNRTL